MYVRMYVCMYACMYYMQRLLPPAPPQQPAPTGPPVPSKPPTTPRPPARDQQKQDQTIKRGDITQDLKQQ